VEIILNMREKMSEMQTQIEEFVSTLNHELVARRRPSSPEEKHSLICVVNARSLKAEVRSQKPGARSL